jgi:ribosomal protein S18 acetylase RimI-like enzyme
MATFLLGEAFRLLYEHGFAVIEVQTMEENAGALALYESLGFDIIDRGSVYRKESP